VSATVIRAVLLCKNVDIKVHSTIILSFVSYGCETWSRTLREEQRLWVFESRVLREGVCFGLRETRGNRGMEKITYEELCGFYSSLNILLSHQGR